MSENEQRGLQRLDLDSKLPAGFHDLSEEEQRAVVKRLQDQDIEIRGEMLRKAGKSKIAEHDLAVGIDAVQRLDHERKIYSKKMKGETGSGTYDLQIQTSVKTGHSRDLTRKLNAPGERILWGR